MDDTPNPEPYGLPLAAMRVRATAVIESANAIIIDSQQMLELARDELKEIKAVKDDFEAKRNAARKPHRDALADIDERLKEPRQFLDDAEKVVRGAISNWLAEQERIAAQARRAAEEAERQRRLEAAAAAEKARKESEAAAAAAQAEQDFDRRREAEARAADAAAAAQAASVEAVVSHQVAAAPEPKVSGVSGRKNYSAECVSILELAAYIVSNPQYANLLKIDQTALNALARAQKEMFKLPGCKLLTKTVTVVR